MTNVNSTVSEKQQERENDLRELKNILGGLDYYNPEYLKCAQKISRKYGRGKDSVKLMDIISSFYKHSYEFLNEYKKIGCYLNIPGWYNIIDCVDSEDFRFVSLEIAKPEVGVSIPKEGYNRLVISERNGIAQACYLDANKYEGEPIPVSLPENINSNVWSQYLDLFIKYAYLPQQTCGIILSESIRKTKDLHSILCVDYGDLNKGFYTINIRIDCEMEDWEDGSNYCIDLWFNVDENGIHINREDTKIRRGRDGLLLHDEDGLAIIPESTLETFGQMINEIMINREYLHEFEGLLTHDLGKENGKVKVVA